MLHWLTEQSHWPWLLELACKSLALLALAWLLTQCLQRASAAARHLVWSVALLCLLALPLLSLALPAWRVEWLSAVWTPAAATATNEEPRAVAPVAETSWSVASPAVAVAPLAAATKPSLPPAPSAPLRLLNQANRWLAWLTWPRLLLGLWLLGVGAVLARLAVGTGCVWWLTRRAQPVTESAWLTLTEQVAARLGLRQRVPLLRSAQVEMPMTWGAWRAVVLLPTEAENWPAECRNIVLLHELAHIKRRDCLTQLLAQLACALYWFNPLVWLAARRLRVERELACDDYVLAVGTKASDYAAQLVGFAGNFQTTSPLAPVTVGMACSHLESRVRAILDPAAKRRHLNVLSTLSLTLLVGVLVLPLAMLQPWTRAQAERRFSAASATALVADAGLADAGLPSTALMTGGMTAATTAGTTAALTSESSPQTAHTADALEPLSPSSALAESHAVAVVPEAAAPAPVANVAPVQEPRPAANPQASPAPSKELTVEQIIQMKVHNVTPEFGESIRRAGFENVSVNQLVELRVHGIDEAYLKEVRNWGFDKATLRDIVHLRVAGVTPTYLASLKQAGYDNLTINKVATLKLHGITPEYIANLRQLGFDKLSADKVAAFKIHGIDEAFIKQAQAMSSEKLSADDLLQLKISGFTPAYAQSLKALGFDNVPLRKLSELRLHGVSEDYIREMRGLGFENLTVNQLLQLRIHGVTADYVKKLRAAGFKNVSVNQLLDLRIHGVDDILLKGNR